MDEVGYVVNSRDFLVEIDGLPTVRIADLVVNDQGVRALIASLGENYVEAWILDEGEVTPGQLFRKEPITLGISVGDFLLGRAINPLGVAIDGKGPLAKAKAQFLELDQQVLGIYAREFIKEQFVTGITTIDTLLPIGKGQRELVMGDAHSGKTSFLIDLIINQKKAGVICIYASIGKPAIDVRNLINTLNANKALSHAIIIAASSAEPPPLIFLTPSTGFTIAEYFQRKGMDVLLILDDLGNHAKIYREISLLGGRSPGRESYPGDIFYQHSHLMERAGYFKKSFGGGSITAIPVIELNLDDFTTFIPTNLMAMTDGHLLFRSSLQNQGNRPAIDISLSVSRVGRQTQARVQNLLSQRIRQVLAQAESLETISRFSSELTFETQLILHRKGIILELLRQDFLTKLKLETQVILLGLVFTSFLEDKAQGFIKKNKLKLIEATEKDSKLQIEFKNILSLTSDLELFKILEKFKSYLEQICR